MHNTIFEKIIAREIPADIVYEDDLVLAFLDIQPNNHGHTLIVPKKKFRNVFDGDPRVLGHMMEIAQKLAIALREITKCDGINITMNNEEASGQIVFHAHLHVIPRFLNDGVFGHSKRIPYDEAVAKKIAALLREKLV